MSFPERGNSSPTVGVPAVAAVAVSGNERSYVDWPSIWAGASIAVAISLVLTAFGGAVGLATSSSLWSPRAATSQSVGIIATAWLAFTYIWPFGVGGYLAGRMRPSAGDSWRSERGFRDGVNGLVVWAIGVIVVTVLVALASGLGAAIADNSGSAAAVSQTTDLARRAAAFAGFWSTLVLLLSGVGAWFAAWWGGHHRDRVTF